MNRREANEIEMRLGFVGQRMLDVAEAMSAASRAIADLTATLSPLVRRHPVPGDTVEVHHPDRGWIAVEVTSVGEDRFSWIARKERFSSATLWRELGWWRWPPNVELAGGSSEPEGGAL